MFVCPNNFQTLSLAKHPNEIKLSFKHYTQDHLMHDIMQAHFEHENLTSGFLSYALDFVSFENSEVHNRFR